MTRLLLSAFICVHLRLIAGPLWFEPNQGQAHPSVQFLAHTSNAYVYLGRNQMAVRDVRMQLDGARPRVKAELEEPLGGISSYFAGKTEKDWHTGIPQYGRVRYHEVYRGIDLLYYASGGNLEYDFVLKPGADPSTIRLAYNRPVRIDDNGDLLIAGLRQKRPRVLQNGHEIACDYLVRDRNHVQLALAQYDRSQPLSVDPVLEFSTYLGGPGYDYVDAVKLDSSGFIYVAGGTESPATPSLNPFQQSQIANDSPFVLKFRSDARRVIYFAVLDGNGFGSGRGIAVDASGSAVVAGETRSTNFPLKNPVQSEFKAALDNAFITKLTPDGRSLVYSTYLGGSYREQSLAGVVLDSQGNAYFGGYTQSPDFPVKNAIQPRRGDNFDCFLAKMSPAGALLFATYLGGSKLDSCFGLAVDAHDSVYIAGETVSDDFPLKNPVQATKNPNPIQISPMLVKLSPDGQSFVFSTFLGGTSIGGVTAVAFDAVGNIYVGGGIKCQGAPITANAFQRDCAGGGDAYVVKLDPSGSKILYATYLGGSGGESVRSMAVDSNGSMYLVGTTSSPDFPVKNSLQPFAGGGFQMADIFVTKIAPSGNSLVYSTLFGGYGNKGVGLMALDAAGSVYFGGGIVSQDFPTVNAYQPLPGGGNDGYLAKISDNTPLSPSPLIATPARLLFRYTQSGALPAAQSASVAGPAFTVASTATWLSASVAGSKVTVSVDPTALAPGIHNGTVSLIPTADTPAGIDVTLMVLSPTPVLTSVEPALIPAGSDNTVITLHGSGFAKDVIVLLYGSAPVTPVVFVDSNTLRVTLPQIDLRDQTAIGIIVKNPTSDPSNSVTVSVGVPAPAFTAAGITNAASFATGPVAPGEIVTIFGTNLDQNVTFDAIPATLVYFSPMQVSVTVPYQVTGPTTSIRMGLSVIPVVMDVAPSAPGIFAAVSDGDGILTLYATGGGVLSKDDLPLIQLPVVVTVNSNPADILYAGIAPGLAEGVNQINIRVPDGTRSGQVTLVLKVGDAASKEFTTTLP